ncbi:hypothetical protein HHX47_DHR1001323, partial [Lentinula edodes]
MCCLREGFHWCRGRWGREKDRLVVGLDGLSKGKKSIQSGRHFKIFSILYSILTSNQLFI